MQHLEIERAPDVPGFRTIEEMGGNAYYQCDKCGDIFSSPEYAVDHQAWELLKHNKPNKTQMGMTWD